MVNSEIMSRAELKEDLHEMIDKADDRVLNMIYAMLRADMSEDHFELNEADKVMLTERLEKSRKDRSAGSDLETVVARVKAQL